ncbi:glutathione S-transferase [Aeromonas hydrophila]|uniref:glutathione S-transferase family protein n=1 Tax=Aeromonas hydrophila TaxID=644 RepID=UPI0011173874|nr:glutathione S-transferase family protein [Aeromonas hydrophila]TNH90775.1 glutathione S-transferase [Aeromonas hydrophila]TNH94929.1 glutathione S-transferase [Aeromonas hydrophila]TNI93005.1 glutathione S-transferase [Aeromonas hydrophila]
MSELILYLTPGTCAMAVRIALVEAGAPHQIRRVDFASGEQRSPAYLAINPKGRVPALVTERGVLTETPALLLYVAQRFPDAKLAPLNDPFLLARMQEVNSFLASTVHVAHAHSRRAARWADDPQAIAAMQVKVPHNMREGFAEIERHYLAGPWVLGERFSLADIYLFVVASWLEGDGVAISEFPKVADHYRRMLARPGVQQGLAL